MMHVVLCKMKVVLYIILEAQRKDKYYVVIENVCTCALF